MADFAKMTDAQREIIKNFLDSYDRQTFSEIPHDDPEYGEKYRAKVAATETVRKAVYTEWLAQALFDHGFIDDRVAAEFVIEQLFTWLRDSGSSCVCSCHPRLGDSDLHGFGFRCSCGFTAEERREAAEQWLREWDELHDDPEMQEWQAKQDELWQEALVWLGNDPALRDFRQLSSACPEQWQGIVDDHPFYFRERHDLWRIELGARLAAEEIPKHHVDTERARGFSSYYDSGDYTTVAEGAVEELGSTPRDHLQFIVMTIRDHLRRTSCTHPLADDTLDNLARKLRVAADFCPTCGVRLAQA